MATNNGQASELVGSVLQVIKDRDGEWIANAPHTRDLIARLIDSGITDAAELTGLVELSGGKRYDPALASSHYLGVWSCIHRPT